VQKIGDLKEQIFDQYFRAILPPVQTTPALSQAANARLVSSIELQAASVAAIASATASAISPAPLADSLFVKDTFIGSKVAVAVSLSADLKTLLSQVGKSVLGKLLITLFLPLRLAFLRPLLLAYLFK
jgi:hypothetical protein